MSYYGRAVQGEEDTSYPRHRSSSGHANTTANNNDTIPRGGRERHESLEYRGRHPRPRSRSHERYLYREEDIPRRHHLDREEEDYRRSIHADHPYRRSDSMPFPIEHTIPYYHDHPMRREEYEEHQRHYSRSLEPRDRTSHSTSANGYDRRSLSPSPISRRSASSYSRYEDSPHGGPRDEETSGRFSAARPAVDSRRSNYPPPPNGGGGRGGGGGWASQEPSRPPSSSSSSSSSHPLRKTDSSFATARGPGSSSAAAGRGGAPKKKPFIQIDPNPKMAITNVIPADITRNFNFYLYGLCCTSKTKNMDGTNVTHGKLFYTGIEKWLREKMAYTQTQIDDVLRVVFFEGSAVLSSRKIPGIEKADLPFLVHQDLNDGDSVTLMSFECFRAPTCLHPSSPVDETTMMAVDFRCANCTTAFATQDALLSHCKSLGHSPVFAPELVESSTGPNGQADTTIRPATVEVFLAFCNVALQRALSERLARWGKDFIDSTSFTTPSNRFGKSLGVRVFRAFRCEFTIGQVAGKETLILSIDINAKIIRTTSVLDAIYGGRDPRITRLDDVTVAEMRQKWINEQVICLYDKKTYTVVDILFDRSPATMPIEGLNNMSHAEYFEKKKGIALEYPNVIPLLQVYGRNKSTIYFPAELVCGNQFDLELKAQLPIITSFMPKERNDAIDEMKRYLKAGAQKSKTLSGLLPAIGIVLAEDRVNVPVDVLPLPDILLSGIRVPKNRATNWAPVATRASFNVQPGDATLLNVVLVYNKRLHRNYISVYKKLASMVNGHSSSFRLPDFPYACIEAGDLQHHWEAVEQFFRSERKLPPNIFVIDFNQPPRGSDTDPAYPVIKEFLARYGFLSQFVNFNCNSHSDQDRRSNLILGAVGRQILNKCGARIWWVDVPRSIPLPAVIVGVDVFHAPRRFDPRLGKYFAKESVAAVVVQLIRRFDKEDKPVYEVFSKTERRRAGGEYEVGSLMEETVKEALHRFKVNPLCCICWRDGVGDSSITHVKTGEIPPLRKALMNGIGYNIPTAYIVCQKRISTKFISMNGTDGMPPGALIQDVGSSAYQTFYIHGPNPPISTPRSIRYLVVERDEGVQHASLPELAWALSHDYPNWPGPIKVPSVVQLAHKLAEMAGNFAECGEEIDYNSNFSNTLHFL